MLVISVCLMQPSPPIVDACRAPWHSAFNLSTHEVHISRVDMLAEFMFMERQLQVLQWQRRQRGDQRW